MRSYKVSDKSGQEFEVSEEKLHEAEADGFLPVVTNGKDTHRVSQNDFKWAHKDGYKPVSSSDVSKTESGARGAAQGLSMGFADEITGGLESAFTHKTYEQARDESRAAYDESQEANPATYMGSQVAGGIASAFVPGLNVAKGASMAAKIGMGAGLGGATGLGNSEADLTKGEYGDALKDTAMGAAIGGGLSSLAEVAIPIATKGLGSVKGSFKNMAQKLEKTPIANADEVALAAKNIGVEPLDAMMTSNPAFQKLESGLSQSGSFAAANTRDKYNQFFKGVDKATEKISSMRSPDSTFSIGKDIQSGLTQQVNDLRVPVSEMYTKLEPRMRKIPVDVGATNSAFGVLKKNSLFNTKDGMEMLEEFKANVLQQPKLNSLKEFRSEIGDTLTAMSSPRDVKRIEALRNVVTDIRDRSINAQKGVLPKKMHEDIDDLINQIALADSAHASNLGDVNSIKSMLGNKDMKSPVTFLNKLGEMKEADLAERASNLDVTSLRNMQSKFPSIFEKAREAKINDMIERSSRATSGFNETTFLNQYDKMANELKELIFDPKMQAYIKDLRTVKAAIPESLGPSGTPEGLMTMDMWGPTRNVQDFLIRKSLNNPKVGENVLGSLSGGIDSTIKSVEHGGGINSLQRAPLGFAPHIVTGSPQIQFPRAADNQEASNKPPDKEMLLKKTQGTKYSQVLQNAANKSDQSLAAANYVLGTRDENYRKLMDENN